MLGIAVQLTLSWLIVWWYERGNLSFLGWQPTWNRIKDFSLFFLVTAVCCSTGFLLRIYWGNESWQWNNLLTGDQAIRAAGWHIKSVLFEELIFRGVLFYLLWKKAGSRVAIVVSSAAFGVYHWFSQELWGNPIQMIYVFILSGIMGMVYAYGYVKTKSLYAPCAIHLGWNFTQGFVFSAGVTGPGLFILAPMQQAVTLSYATYYALLFLPIVSAWIVNYLLLQKRNNV